MERNSVLESEVELKSSPGDVGDHKGLKRGSEGQRPGTLLSNKRQKPTEEGPIIESNQEELVKSAKLKELVVISAFMHKKIDDKLKVSFGEKEEAIKKGEEAVKHTVQHGSDFYGALSEVRGLLEDGGVITYPNNNGNKYTVGRKLQNSLREKIAELLEEVDSGDLENQGDLKFNLKEKFFKWVGEESGGAIKDYSVMYNSVLSNLGKTVKIFDTNTKFKLQFLKDECTIAFVFPEAEAQEGIELPPGRDRLHLSVLDPKFAPLIKDSELHKLFTRKLSEIIKSSGEKEKENLENLYDRNSNWEGKGLTVKDFIDVSAEIKGEYIKFCSKKIKEINEHISRENFEVTDDLELVNRIRVQHGRPFLTLEPKNGEEFLKISESVGESSHVVTDLGGGCGFAKVAMLCRNLLDIKSWAKPSGFHLTVGTNMSPGCSFTRPEKEPGLGVEKVLADEREQKPSLLFTGNVGEAGTRPETTQAHSSMGAGGAHQ